MNVPLKQIIYLLLPLVSGVVLPGCSIRPELFGNVEVTPDLLQYREPNAIEWIAYPDELSKSRNPKIRELVVKEDPSRGVGNKAANSMGGGEAPLPRKGKFRVFLFMGQSNMVGYGKAAKLGPPYNEAHTRVQIWAKGKWQYLVPQKSFGPEVAFAHNVANHFPHDTIGIIKIAVIGTGINAWKPDWDWSAASKTGDALKGSLYRDMINSVAEAHRVSNFETGGLIWKQGGRDGRKWELAKTYQDRFVELVEHVRVDLGAPDLPVFVLTYFDETGLEIHRELIEKIRPKAFSLYLSKARVSHYLENAYPVFHGRLPTRLDKVHFDTEGQIRLGEMTAQAVISYYQKNDPPTEKRAGPGPVLEPPIPH